MSLLMDALRKAELAKRQSPRDQVKPSISSAPPEALELTPLASTPEPFAGAQSIPPSAVEAEAARVGSLPQLPSTLEFLDQNFMDEAFIQAQRKPENTQERSAGRVGGFSSLPVTPAPSIDSSVQQRIAAETRRERESVQNLFEAKQAPASSHKTLATIGLLSLLAAAAIGIYFWLQLQPQSALVPAGGAVSPIAVPPRPVVTAPPVLPVVEPTTNAPASPAAAPSNEVQNNAAQPASNRQTIPPLDIPIRVTTSKLRVDPTVDTAFNALQSGDLSTAQAAYERSLNNDPKNADALHGLASVHLRQGKPDLAQNYYLRAFEADPKDALAQASLISMSGQIDPVQSESRLKLLLATQPDSPFLHFYLGNLYARQNRWAEAQQEYFKAMAGEPDNPDYLFNLAVSLDQLHQAKVAAQYYAQALSAADKQSFGFDKQQVSDRLKKLRP